MRAPIHGREPLSLSRPGGQEVTAGTAKTKLKLLEEVLKTGAKAKWAPLSIVESVLEGSRTAEQSIIFYFEGESDG